MAVLRAQTHPPLATEAHIARCGARYSGLHGERADRSGQAVRAQAAAPAVSWDRGESMAVAKGKQDTASSEKAADRSRDGVSCSEQRGIQEVMA